MPQSNQDNEIMREFDQIPFPHEKTCVNYAREITMYRCNCQREIYINLCKQFISQVLSQQKKDIVALAEGMKKLYNGDDEEEYIDYCENYNEALSDIINKLSANPPMKNNEKNLREEFWSAFKYTVIPNNEIDQEKADMMNLYIRSMFDGYADWWIPKLASQRESIIKECEGMKKLFNGDDEIDYITHCEGYNEALDDLIKKLEKLFSY